jgi:hypothetical protein
MSILAPLCAVIGHKRSRALAHFDQDGRLVSRCARCDAPLVKTASRWRPKRR